jgi:DNA ligase 1
VSSLDIQFINNSVHLPKLGLWLDAHDPITNAETVFISHAHSDHTAPHREVILSEPTSKFMFARIGGTRQEHVLKFDQPATYEYNGTGYQITLVPAGHIFGSAMSLVEAEGQSLLYTGDFKLRPSRSAELCEPRPADILIMETTFGRPIYQFPPTDEVMQGVIRFCQQALDNDETPVLYGYSLGKSQELLRSLGLPIMLHAAVHKLTEIYKNFGQTFPDYELYDAATARGKVLVCPPHIAGTAMLRKLGKTRTAILTGWAVDPGCRYRYQCDAAFPISDHADFPDLIEMVKRVNPKKVYTLHGFAADFAQSLRELGYNAQALSQQEQFTLDLAAELKSKITKSRTKTKSTTAAINNSNNNHHHSNGSHSFQDFAQACATIAADSRKLEKVRILAEYFRLLQESAVPITATWLTGQPFPSSQNKTLNVGWAALRNALCAIGDLTPEAFHQIYLKHSDLGETAFEIFQTRAATLTPTLTVERVDDLFHQLQAAAGSLAKLPLLLHVLELCTPLEAKYLIKIITSDLRIGLKEGLVEEAISRAFDRPVEQVRQANLLLGDIGETARLAKRNELAGIGIQPFRPVKCMLASPEESPTTVWDRIQSAHHERSGAGDGGPVPVWLEDKYDGIRCQFHKVGDRVALYSRDLKDITTTFLDLADAARHIPVDFILDGEILAMRGDRALPFSDLQKRLGRKQGDLFMQEEVPIKYVAFDLLWLNNESFLNHPLQQRREKLESLSPLPESFRLAQITKANSIDEIANTFDQARARKNEGLMVKDPTSLYTPGRRGLSWLKLKMAYATLDCVVVGAEYGHGKRKSVLSDYTFAVRDENTDELKTIGKAYSGLTDVEIAQLTEHFLSKVIRQKGRYHEVEPDTVLEIAFDRIQPSNRHNSGLAMRFPRILRIRTDKTPAEIDTLATARQLVKA